MPGRTFLSLVAMAAFTAACGDHVAAPAVTASVVALEPSGGATGVDPSAPIVITFSPAMQSGMESYAALHEGDVTGPVVPGTWMWSDDRATLAFTPAQPLQSQTRYTLHLGGGMRAADGGFVD